MDDEDEEDVDDDVTDDDDDKDSVDYLKLISRKIVVLERDSGTRLRSSVKRKFPSRLSKEQNK